ncbi:hypothetical protein SUGI_1190480 [Cryptomeria japonica]|nr:hypothetical protein SUGI_1190480 [Cryptomeria japonica]
MGFPTEFCFLLIPGLVNLASGLASIQTALYSLLCKLGLMHPQSSVRHNFSQISSPISFLSETINIREALPVTTFKHFAERLGENEEEDVICAVCLSSLEEEDEIRVLCNCCHIFHRQCLDKWINCYQKTCPICRSLLIPQAEEKDHVLAGYEMIFS